MTKFICFQPLFFRCPPDCRPEDGLASPPPWCGEDGKEDDVFALIGPKKVDVPWKEMEQQGWIARARCCEIRIPLPQDLGMTYAVADRRRKFRIASENPAKQDMARELMARHRGKQILLIAMYVDQLKDIAESLGIPLITRRHPPRNCGTVSTGISGTGPSAP